MTWEDVLKKHLVLNYDHGSSTRGFSGTLTIADTGDMVALVTNGDIRKLLGRTIVINAEHQDLDYEYNG